MSVITLAKSFYHSHIKPTIDVESMSFLEGLRLKANQSNASDLSIRKLIAIYNGHRHLLEATGDHIHVANATTDIVMARNIVSRMRECPGKNKLTTLLNTLENKRESLALTWLRMEEGRMNSEGIPCIFVEPPAEPKKKAMAPLQWNFDELSTLQRWRIDNDVPAPPPKRIIHR